MRRFLLSGEGWPYLLVPFIPIAVVFEFAHVGAVPTFFTSTLGVIPTAALMGIDIDKTISRTFVIGGALAGVAGFMFGAAFGVSYTMGFTPGVKAFAAAVLGGIGNIRGAMLGGLLLGEAEVLISAAPFVGAKWNDVVSFLVLVLVLLVRPTGILGERLGRAA